MLAASPVQRITADEGQSGVDADIQVEVILLGFLQAGVDSSSSAVVAHRLGWDFGREEDLGAIDSRVLDGATARAFVAVHDGRVHLWN